MNSLQDTFALTNGRTIPCVGFGTWQTPDGPTAIEAVKTAIQCGYVHIDTAAFYANEQSVGTAIKESGVAREKLFVTSKLWRTDRGYDTALAAFDKSMDKLQLDYLDLFLIHWPAGPKHCADWQQLNQQCWKAFEKLYADGRVKAIGVSNFYEQHLTPLMEKATVMPMVNQIEYHPGQMQEGIVQLCKAHNIVVEAWSPLGSGRMLQNPDLTALASKYQKSVAQLCVRWCLQNQILPLPKSITPGRIAENAHVFDFTIEAQDMATINAMPYCGGSGLHPDEVPF